MLYYDKQRTYKIVERVIAHSEVCSLFNSISKAFIAGYVIIWVALCSLLLWLL